MVVSAPLRFTRSNTLVSDPMDMGIQECSTEYCHWRRAAAKVNDSGVTLYAQDWLFVCGGGVDYTTSAGLSSCFFRVVFAEAGCHQTVAGFFSDDRGIGSGQCRGRVDDCQVVLLLYFIQKLVELAGHQQLAVLGSELPRAMQHRPSRSELQIIFCRLKSLTS